MGSALANEMVIFLDIDGVLVTREEITKSMGRNAKFKPAAVAALNKLCAITGGKIVVTSAWRVGKTLLELRELMASNKVKAPVIGKTLQLTESEMPGLARGRAAEIIHWINEIGYPGDYVVVDDDITDILPHIPPDRVIYVRDGMAKTGLTDSLVNNWIDTNWK